MRQCMRLITMQTQLLAKLSPYHSLEKMNYLIYRRKCEKLSPLKLHRSEIAVIGEIWKGYGEKKNLRLQKNVQIEVIKHQLLPQVDLQVAQMEYHLVREVHQVDQRVSAGVKTE